MKKQLKEIFKFKKESVYFFLIDFAFIVLTALLFYLNEFFSGNQTDAFFNGRTSEQIKQFLVTAGEEQLTAFYTEMKIYLFSVFGSFLLFIIITLLLFTLSRALIWNLITKNKLTRKYYFKWLWFILTTGILFIASLIIFLIIRTLVLTFTSSLSIETANIISQTLNLVYFLAFLFFFFIACRHFAQQKKVFHTIRISLQTIKEKIKPLAKSYFLALIITILISILLFIIFKFITPLQPYINYFNLVLSLAFLAWLRLYLVQILD